MNVIDAAEGMRLVAPYRRGWMPTVELTKTVAEIVAGVREHQDAALVEYTRRFDDPRFDLSRLRVPVPMRDAAKALVSVEVEQALILAKKRITRFHERQRHADLAYVDDDGTRYGLRYRTLDSVAAYVSSARRPHPSAVLMTVIPAKLAGVARTIVLAPPQADGKIDPAVIFACSLCDVDELYAVGGAQAIAAAAYGTPSIAAVDKIVGSGGRWVVEAKRQVFGVCAVDGISGSADVLVVADDGANSEFVAGELLAQAERDELARMAVVSSSRSLLDSVAQLLDTLDISTLPRGDVIADAIARSCLLVQAENVDEIAAFVRAYAPANLALMVRDAEPYLSRITHTGAIFVGDMTPVVCGTYIAGVSNVIPGFGCARFSGGLTLADYMSACSVVENSTQRMTDDAQVLAALADFEGLPQHAQNARMRSGA